MSSSELAAEIISRLPYIDEALTQMNAWVGRSLWLAWQIGHLALAAKKQVEHGQFGEWCRVNVPPLTDRTVQRYMKVAKTTAVSDIKGKSLTEVYHKLGILVEEDRATRTEKQPDLTAEHVFKLPELLARLKSSREFLSACTEEIPFENLEISVIDECAAEFAALSALCERMQRKIAEATAAKPVTGVEIPVDNVNGLSRPTFATTPQEGLEAMGDSTGQS